MKQKYLPDDFDPDAEGYMAFHSLSQEVHKSSSEHQSTAICIGKPCESGEK